MLKLEPRLNYLHLIVLTNCILSAWSQRVNPALQAGRVGNPGLKLHFTNNGVGYLQEIAMRTVNRMIPRVNMPARRQSVNNGRIEGYVDITGMKIVGYRKPRFYKLDLDPPNRIIFRIERMGLK